MTLDATLSQGQPDGTLYPMSNNGPLEQLWRIRWKTAFRRPDLLNPS